MPTNNILLFDQNKVNMLNDSAYSTNQQRLNGVQSGVASGQLQNKFQYQVSLVAYAIASIMYNNGMDANDADAVSAFVSNMSNTLVQKVLDKASTQEAQAGTVNTKWMSPALVKAAIDYCHANAIKFGSNVNVGGNLLVSGTSKMNGAATFANTSTFNGAVTFNGVASGQSPTAASHLATKGYVDEHVDELADELANELANKKVLLYNNNSLSAGDNYIPSFNMLQYQMLYAKGSVSYIVNEQSRNPLNIYYKGDGDNIHNIFYTERNTVGSKISNYESIAPVIYLREIVDEKNLIINNSIDKGIRIDNDGNVISNLLSIHLDYESQYYTITSASIEVYGIKL